MQIEYQHKAKKQDTGVKNSAQVRFRKSIDYQ